MQPAWDCNGLHGSEALSALKVKEGFLVGEHAFTNALIGQSSPYLLAHAHNPVEWNPWCPEAFEMAATLDRPVFLSIGYAACHWCHVMERESFMDMGTAGILNSLFVCVKVDREERPDIDGVYMSAVTALTGRGGWPLSVFLLPDGTPFYGGTYFPPEEKAARYGMPGFRTVLKRVAEAYRHRRSDLVSSGRELCERINRHQEVRAAGPTLDNGLIDLAVKEMKRSHDPVYGGFGGAPKFPQPMVLEFLLRHHHVTGSAESLAMVERTLDGMARGGVCDQVGGGFHRYSTDERWLVPHFEKMLYDNALLAGAYTEAFQVTGRPRYGQVALDTLEWLLRDMQHPSGGFFSTLDADSETSPRGRMEEGAYYTWSPDTLGEVLGSDADMFRGLFGVSGSGNFEGRNILYMPVPLEEAASGYGMSPEDVRSFVSNCRTRLLANRNERPKPMRDEKMITSWNGMAIRAFAAAEAVFPGKGFIDAATRSAEFVLTHLRRGDGRLLRSWKDGDAPGTGFLEDYALFAEGLLALYRADGSFRWLRETVRLVDEMLGLFLDESTMTLFDTGRDQEQLFTRPRDPYDNATPSGTSAAQGVLLSLSVTTGKDRYRKLAERVLSQHTAPMGRMPLGFGRMLCAALFSLSPPMRAVLLGVPGETGFEALLQTLQQPFLPHSVIVRTAPGDEGVSELAPLMGNREMVDGKATAFVCTGCECALPVNDPESLGKLLKKG